MLERQSDAYYYTDEQVQAIALLEQAIALRRQIGDNLGEGDARARLVPYLTCRGLLAEADQAATQAIALLEPLPPSRELARASASMALLRSNYDDLDGAIDWGTRAIALAERTGDPVTLVEASITAGTAELLRDGVHAAVTLERALDLARRHELPARVVRAMHNLAYGALEHHAHELAQRWLDAGLEYCDELELDLWRLSLLAWRAELELEQGRWTEAAATATLLIAEKRDSPEPRNVGLVTLALVRARRGDPGTAQLLAEASAMEGTADDFYRSVRIAAAQAEIAWLERRENGIGKATQTAFDLAVARGSQRWVERLGYWRWKHGIVDELPSGLGEPWALQLAGDWQGAAAAWRALGCPYEEALALSEARRQRALALRSRSHGSSEQHRSWRWSRAGFASSASAASPAAHVRRPGRTARR